MNDFNPSHYEQNTSQIPALHLLMQLGYEYLLPREAHQLRGQKKDKVILKDILRQFLQKQTFTRLGKSYPFSDKTIKEAIEALENIEDVGLIQTNQNIWNLLRLGKSFEETYGNRKGDFNLSYIDWYNPENNLYHVTDEFEIEHQNSTKIKRPDIVLFVNGIPFVTIECKASGIEEPIAQAINQLCNYQKPNQIPHLFHYNQLLLAICYSEAQYGTVGTPRKFWAVWKEETEETTETEKIDAHKQRSPSDNQPLNFAVEKGEMITEETNLATLINTPLTPAQTEHLFTPDQHRFSNLSVTDSRQYYQNNLNQKRTVTAQDKLIYALCRPSRLLEIVDNFSLFDAGERKVARYQQYFTVKNILQRIHAIDQQGKRRGGIVWHTQGSGKSLTMVFLAKAIAKSSTQNISYPDQSNDRETQQIETKIKNPKIMLVTDRTDLDEQIYKTFNNCGAEVVQATTGKELQKLLDQPQAEIITTIINKFDTVINSYDYQNENNNIFVLVDESHRSQFGSFHTNMKRVLPNACFIGFTGTPVQKKDKSTVELFGGMIQPTYTIRKALEDKAIVPLLYESRLADLTIDAQSLDRWFERYTIDLNEAEKAQLKKHFATSAQLNQAEPTIEAIAWDITGHYCTNFKNRGLKAQLVTPNKITAIKYKHYLDQFGKVSSEVLISPPQDKEGDDDNNSNDNIVQQFWAKMMERYGTEKKYQEGIINAFKYQEQPEIIIVVDKLITGFDAPQNTVLYLTRKLRDHRLLQAIARVNRLYEGKEHGIIIDYAGVLQELGEAINLYDSLEGEYEAGDLDDVIITLNKQWHDINQHHSDLWRMFDSIPNRQDNNAFMELLRDEKTRQDFNDKLSQYARTLQLALSSVSFFEQTSPKKIQRYKQDCKFFIDIRQTAARQFGDKLDLKQHQKTVQNLLNTHIKAQDIQTLVELTDIFNVEAFAEEMKSFTNPVAKAEAIASRTMRTINVKYQEDETFYQPLSQRLEEILQQIREKRYQDAQALVKEAEDICNQVRKYNQRKDIPDILRDKSIAQAYYGFIKKVLSDLGIEEVSSNSGEKKDIKTLSGELAIAIAQIIDNKRIINWQNNNDVQNQMEMQIDDYLIDTLEEYKIKLDYNSIDFILKKCINTAIVRLPDSWRCIIAG